MPPQPLDATPAQLAAVAQQKAEGEGKDASVKPKQLAKGVVLGPDGKPYAITSLDVLLQEAWADFD